MTNYTLFIDESGEAGIEKVRTADAKGASPYMTLGAALIPDDHRSALEDSLEKITRKFDKKDLHCSRLNHYQIVHFSREMCLHPIVLFGVISRKETLGWYKDEIDNNSSKYYNKCVQYLLERVGWYADIHKIESSKISVIFEKANFDYSKLVNFVKICQRNPIHERTKKLRRIDVDRFSFLGKKDEPLLQVADLTAHALYRCVDKSERNLGITEPRYLCELSSNFFGHPDTNGILDGGLYCVHSPKDVQLDQEVADRLRVCKAWPADS